MSIHERAWSGCIGLVLLAGVMPAWAEHPPVEAEPADLGPPATQSHKPFIPRQQADTAGYPQNPVQGGEGQITPSPGVVLKLRAGVRVSGAGAQTAAWHDGAFSPEAQGHVGILQQVLRRELVSAIGPVFAAGFGDAALAAAYGLDRYVLIRVPQGVEREALCEELGALHWAIESAEPEGVGMTTAASLPNDTLFAQQWSLNNTGQSVGGVVGAVDADVDGPEAWEITRGSSSVVVAVLDTGVSMSHPDLAGRLVSGYNVTGGSTAATDDNTNDSHGTACAGVIAAGSNTFGVVGIAPDVKIMPVKVGATTTFASEAWLAAGLTWAVDHGAKIGSVSIGFTSGTNVLRDAVLYASERGMLVVASSGNIAGGTVGYPARWDSTLCVGATDARDVVAAFSTAGPQVDVAAPGVNILTTYDVSGNVDGYAYRDGTSFACPLVAGIAALVWSVNPELTNAEVKAIIERTAEDRGSAGWDEQYGYGRVNAHRAVMAARATFPPPCRADWSGDGRVDSVDIFAYINAWTGRLATADFDGNGTIDVGDLFAYLNAWLAKC